MKTNEEILARIAAVEKDDWMGAQTGDLLRYLPFEFARPHLKEGATAEAWEAQRETKPPLEVARDYLSFAWDKANNCRGLSAGRSLDHMMAWLWLAGFDDLVESEFEDYSHYGKRQLVIASVLCDFDWRKHDDGRWANDEEGQGLSEVRLRAEIEDAESVALKHAAAVRPNAIYRADCSITPTEK